MDRKVLTFEALKYAADQMKKMSLEYGPVNPFTVIERSYLPVGFIDKQTRKIYTNDMYKFLFNLTQGSKVYSFTEALDHCIQHAKNKLNNALDEQIKKLVDGSTISRP